MIIGALPSGFPSIIDSAPQEFGVFYWNSEQDPDAKHFATVSKRDHVYLYRFARNEAEASIFEFHAKDDLVARMTADNLQYNAGKKCTVEF